MLFVLGFFWRVPKSILMTINKKIRKRLLFAHRRLREWKMIAKGLLSTRHPVLAHIIPTRRCNLSCTYCNE